MKRFEQIPHTADIKVRVYGSTKKELFVNALYAMFTVVGPHAQGCRYEGQEIMCDELPEHHDVEIRAPDSDALLVTFLSQALSLSDIHNQAFFDADIHEFDDVHLKATIKGVHVTGFEVVELKAVTYHDLAIKEVNGLWQTDIVFDI